MTSGIKNAIKILLIVAALIIYWAFFLREYSDWTERISLAKGGELEVDYVFSNKVYHGHPHVFGWGGDDPRYKLTFEHPFKRKITWKGAHTPIILDVQDNIVYLVVFDRETDFNKIRFKFYKFKDNWHEISHKEFPKSIAKQNTWLNKGEIVDSSSSDFNSSLTARLWLQLEQNEEYYESKNAEIPWSFLAKYEKIYMPNSF